MTSSTSGWKTLLKLFLAGMIFASGCLFFGLGKLIPLDSEQGPRPSPVPGLADLGMVLVPDSTPLQEARTYTWRVDTLAPSEHQVGYGLGASLIDRLEREHAALGRRLKFRPLSPERFTYRGPPGCQQDMRCIYDEVMRTNAEPVRALGEHFIDFIRARQLSPAQAAAIIVGFVQRIRYELPTDAFGLIPPALIPAQDRGDCDSKALLAVMLLRQAGIDAVMLYSDPLAHAAVGIGLPGSGTSLRLGGRTYRYAEVTSVGWPIGMIPPRYDQPRQWKLLPLSDLDDAG